MNKVAFMQSCFDLDTSCLIVSVHKVHGTGVDQRRVIWSIIIITIISVNFIHGLLSNHSQLMLEHVRIGSDHLVNCCHFVGSIMKHGWLFEEITVQMFLALHYIKL